MNIFICIDDTDTIDTPGTGHLAEAISKIIEKKYRNRCSGITRHQLFVHKDVPYTSHNSAMCFTAEIDKEKLPSITSFCQEYLEEKSAPGSDPGLCIADMNRISNKRELIDFGFRAKKMVLTMDNAYELAESLNIHLTEHGGTGQGVIGALAGTGLRLSGNDGRFRGWYHLGKSGKTISVKKLCSHDFIDSVRAVDGKVLGQNENLLLSRDRIKTVMQNHEQVVLVSEFKDKTGSCRWKSLAKEETKAY
jgi:hypothetical protein